mmetsp:Transcript_14939/g.16608  ORF Transcript_14939/g.16608 Transcript_14939/m.16608 type:complete len:386 (+) Transcript_14939:19-1176(+)
MRFIVLLVSAICITLTFGYDRNEMIGKLIKSRGKLLPPGNTTQQRACPHIERSTIKPTNVHCLKFSDIDTIAALGDSLTAGFGADCYDPEEQCWNFDYRGVAWDIGNDANAITLTNFFQRYNENIYGGSVGIGGPDDPNAFLNRALSGAYTSNMPYQAETLIEKMKSDPKVDYENDWKFISLFIGDNNLCPACKTQHDIPDPNSAALRRFDMELALDTLLEIPRVIVNLQLVLNPLLLADLGIGDELCEQVHQYACPCVVGSPDDKAYTTKMWSEYLKISRELATLPKYDKEDFTIIIQPMFEHSKLPLDAMGIPDRSYFALDCFHFSKKAHEAGAINLWNSLQLPDAAKPDAIDFKATVKCPDPERNPYVTTSKNRGGTICPVE